MTSTTTRQAGRAARVIGCLLLLLVLGGTMAGHRMVLPPRLPVIELKG
jgi:hypothetical protein